MVQNNKVLTVSYGTFSCTLEGFEDSFETMKAIAEYFRDLAADDRYFGAEPPQPDADMLARIAQREISRQVEARRESGGIVLRAADLAAAGPALAGAASGHGQTDQAALVPADADSPAAQPDTVAERDAVPETNTAGEPGAADAPDANAHTGAEESAARAAPLILSQPDIAAASQAARQAEEQLADKPANMPEADEAAAAPIVGAPAEQTHEVMQEDDDDLPMAQDLPVEDADETFVPAADSIAAKLQRIRAVVSRNERAEAQDDYTEDQHADAFTAQAAEDIMHALGDDPTRSDSAADPDHDGLEHEDHDEDGDSDIAAILQRFEDGEPLRTTSYDDAADDDAQAASAGSLFDDLDDEAEASEGDDDLANIMGGDDENAPQRDGQAERHDRPAAAPGTARVVKIKRSEFDAAVAAGHLEELPVEDAAPEDTGSSLSEEAEADLIRELADVEAEFALAARSAGGTATEAEAEDEAEDDWAEDGQMGDDGAGRPHRPLSASMDENEDDFTRLMDEAGEKLSDPEAAARHETYSHMRAAVATTKAERSAGGTMGSHTDDDPYRDDLASVVRPRRPEAPQGRPQRPSNDTRPAPLKLVAEQRVDDGAGPATRGPVHPRRVSTQLLDESARTGTPTPEGGFAEFAAEVGASELPDLLEAAAAYMSFVEGRAQFSRPQLMGKVRQVESTDFNREDGLRSFGQLLRDGKIEKKGGGRFAASSRIGFRPDDERAAG
ncbi:MAG: chemotaxis protein CheA [Jhaorihella sp.]